MRQRTRKTSVKGKSRKLKVAKRQSVQVIVIQSMAFTLKFFFPVNGMWLNWGEWSSCGVSWAQLVQMLELIAELS